MDYEEAHNQSYEKVIDILEKRTGKKNISEMLNLGFDKSGFDSLECIDFVLELEDEFDIELNELEEKIMSRKNGKPGYAILTPQKVINYISKKYYQKSKELENQL